LAPSAHRKGSLTDKAVYSGYRVGVSAGDRSAVLDAGQLRAHCSGDVDGAERSACEHEAVLVAFGVDVGAGDLGGVVDTEGGRAGGQGEVDRGEGSAVEQ